MIIYSGPSKIDGKPIVAIMTGLTVKSHNSKTGAMPQVWIIRSDIHPTEALRTGEDVSICGNCPHRPKAKGPDALRKFNRTCYVNTMSFNAVYKTYKAGKYETANLADLATRLVGNKVRIGAYGDPAAVPIEVWDKLLAHCDSTGYTHQWETCDAEYSKYCMASCDTPMQVIKATAMGYRVFFVQNVHEYNNIIKSYDTIKFAHCPASKEKGKTTTCAKCMACNGTRFDRKSQITIMLH